MASPAAQLPDELASPVATAIQTGDWSALEQLLESGQLSDQQKAGVIVAVTKSADDHQISQHVSPYCSNAQFSSAMAQLISAGCWTKVWNLCRCVGHEHREWQVDNLSVSNHLLATVAKGRWKELGAVLRSLSPAQRRWALLEACRRAVQLDIIRFIENILPQCTEEDLDCVLHELVSRGLWWAVGSLFSQKRAISETQRTQALNKAAKEATTWEISDFILPHCTKHELISVSKLLVTRRLWWCFADLLKKDMFRFVECMLAVCGNEETDLFMSHLWNEGRTQSVKKLLKIAGSQKSQWKIGEACVPGELIKLAAEGQWTRLTVEAQRVNPAVLAWAMGEISKKAGEREIDRIDTSLCPISQIPFVITNLVKRGFMEKAALLLCEMVKRTMTKRDNALRRWGWPLDKRLTGVSDTAKNNEKAFWSLLRNTYDLKDVYELCCKVSEVKNIYKSSKILSDLSRPEYSPHLLSQVLFDSALSIIVVSLCDRLNDSSTLQSIDHQVESTMTKILNKRGSGLDYMLPKNQHLSAALRSMARDDSTTHPVFALSFISALEKRCFDQGWDPLHSSYLLTCLTGIPIVPEIQRQALGARLNREDWHTLRVLDLSCVGEQMRRSLFSSAVKQKQWNFVKQRADHSLTDDQRSWAMEEACKEEQWDVYLHLAEHGLSEGERVCVHFNVALRADRSVVFEMYEDETDIVEVKEWMTESTSPGSEAATVEELLCEERIFQLSEIEAKLKSRMACLQTLESAIERGDWQVVVFTLRQDPTAAQGNMALQAAVAGQAWRAVRQMLRLGIPLPDPHSFFLDMVRSRQWGVCRVMIEQGLTAKVHVDVLPQLMDLNQWSLVGRIMDSKVEDAVRRQVMTRALQSREGSVVSKAILGLKQGLSLQEREDVFHRAIIRGVLQAVVPLVSEKDDTGIRHRDAALLHAIRERQWDMVDVCQHHQADINVRDDRGEFLIHKAAQQGDWATVLGLAEGGSELSVLDSTGLSVLHRAIESQQWGSVKSLIALGSDFQQSAKPFRKEQSRDRHMLFIVEREKTRSPLEMLIDMGHERLITTALSEARPVRWQGKNSKGETALHTFCLSGWWRYIPRLLVQGVDPFSVTPRGHSALTYAVLCKSLPLQTVTSCISLGFSTHQSHITHTMQQSHGLSLFPSPLLFSVMRGLPKVTRMLYESGSCSRQELFQSLPHLHELTDFNSLARSSLGIAFDEEISRVPFHPFAYYWRELKQVRKSARYLMKVSARPRSLKSTCRLVISHCLKISGTREEDIAQLPLPKSMKDYLLFSDLSAVDCCQQEAGCENHGMGHREEEEWSASSSEDEKDSLEAGEEQWYATYEDEDEDWYSGSDEDE